LFRDKETLTPS